MWKSARAYVCVCVTPRTDRHYDTLKERAGALEEREEKGRELKRGRSER